MEAFVTGNEFVGLAEARHEAAVFKVEGRGKGAKKKDTFNGGKGYKPFSIGVRLFVAPLESPGGFLAAEKAVQNLLVRREQHQLLPVQ
jgi:hypothetical protein